jgi:TrmH family RNA methyltransferase
MARRDPSLAILAGFHAVKHALRFGADIEEVVTCDLADLMKSCRDLAPDVEGSLRSLAGTVSPAAFRQLAKVPPDTGVIAIARRRTISALDVLGSPRSAPAVLLERPSHLGNVGAVIRVAASAGASAVITTGAGDPWHPAALRGSAGLHYAVPVAHAETLSIVKGPFLAIHPSGNPLRLGAIPSDALLAFGSESRGLSQELISSADERVSIPMQSGVSSMNLATAVAVVLYAWRLAQRG